MTQLSSAALKSAVQFNRSRPYSRADWRRIQQAVGSGVDGVPGAGTAEKIALFQSKRGLSADGKAGQQTLQTMGITIIDRNSVYAVPKPEALFFCGGMAIDADGAPNAYNEEDTGIDYLANAGRPGNWYGLSVDDNGRPYKQKDGPFAGHYVSTTALADGNYGKSDPRRYVDSTKIPYIALPGNFASLVANGDSMRKGDLLAVIAESDLADSDGRDLIYAIYADVGPKHSAERPHLGEGSVALAQALGHDPFVIRKDITRASRSITSELVYILFPGSGDRKPLTASEIESRGQAAFEQRGGVTLLGAIRKMLGLN